jgi:hypothetical protein
MKVLVYGNRKSEEMWDASTPEKEEAAFKALFKFLDEEWDCYCELADAKEPVMCEACSKTYCAGCTRRDTCACKEKSCPSNANHNDFEKFHRIRWVTAYQKAKAGDYKAMRSLMNDRSSRHYEYEEFHFVKVKDATA